MRGAASLAHRAQCGPRAASVGVALWLTLAMLLPTAGAAVSDETIVITRSTYRPINWNNVDVAEGDDPGAGIIDDTAPAPGCSADYLSITSDRLTFSESEQQAGCVEARLSLDVPDGATGFTVAFNADRRISSGQVAEASGTPPRAEQEIRVYGRDADTVVESYHDDDGPSAKDARFSYDFDVVQSPVLAFWFADVGQTGSSTGQTDVSSNHGFSSTIHDAEVVFHGIPAKHTIKDLGTINTETTSVIRAATVVQGFDEDLVVVLPRGTEVVSLTLDDVDGPAVPAEQVQEELSNAGTTLTIAHTDAARTLVVTYETVTASIQSAFVGAFSAITILLFIPLAIMAFLPLTKDRFNKDGDEE